MTNLNENTATFRFYEELNDFLPPEKKKKNLPYNFKGNPAVKDAIEAFGVPHTEIDLIVANGLSVGFDYQLQHDDAISVYPVFESFNISPLVKLRSQPLRSIKFVLDVHLGKLMRILRMLGFDSVYRNDFNDEEIISLALKENRIILTRDRGILKNKSVTHGYCIRSTRPLTQVVEVIRRFDLTGQVKPFNRCICCNGVIRPVEKTEILQELPKKVAEDFKEFYQCRGCGKVYWQGSHYERMRKKIEAIISEV
jgi:uncharacterized protein with PIN domain